MNSHTHHALAQCGQIAQEGRDVNKKPPPPEEWRLVGNGKGLQNLDVGEGSFALFVMLNADSRQLSEELRQGFAEALRDFVGREREGTSAAHREVNSHSNEIGDLAFEGFLAGVD